MSWYINVYPPLEGEDLPFIRRFLTKEKAQAMFLPGCLGTVELTFPLERLDEKRTDQQ